MFVRIVFGKVNDICHNLMCNVPQCKKALKLNVMPRSFQRNQTMAYSICVMMGCGLISKALNLTLTNFGFVPMIYLLYVNHFHKVCCG
jgi:hypothetical protein